MWESGEIASEEARIVGDELILLRREIDVLELKFSELAARFAGTDEHDRQGFATPIEWIRINCNLSGPTAADRVAVGKHISEFPESIQAIREGEIGFGHLVVMTRTADALKSSKTAAPFAEGQLLDMAKESTVGKLYHLCQDLRHAKDPVGFATDEAMLIEQRRLKLNLWPNGALTLSGVLDPIGGAAVRSALEPLARQSGAHDNREPEQRMADALVELAGGGEPKVQLQVTSSLETLLALAGSPAADMEFTLPISSRAVERMACDCSITRVLLGSESVVIDVGRAKRVVSGPARRALDARDGGCKWPGCERPAKWSAAHHFVHWTKGGSTNLDNLILLCHRHHTMVHEGNWQIVRDDGGRILTIPPPTRFMPWARGPD